MHAETYVHLKAKYDVDNFEQIAEAMEKHFCDLFRLDVLDSEAKENATGSYAELFDLCMKELKDLYTVKEVVEKMHSILAQGPIHERLSSRFHFVPAVGPHSSRQLGFLEKAATDELRVAEPLTYIDMVRNIHGLQALKEKRFSAFEKIEIVQLQNLSSLNPFALKHSNRALVVNFNRDLKGHAKWGVVDLEDISNPRVFCETPLTEAEKQELERSLQIKVSEFVGAKANSLPSTGYTALAWLDSNITKAWNFDVNADFATLLREVILVQYGGDNPGLTHTFAPLEREKYATQAFRHALRIESFSFWGGSVSSGDSSQAGFAMARLTWIAALGQIEGTNFRPGDLAAVIKIAEQNHWGYEGLKPYVYKSMRTLPPRFEATITQHEDPKLIDESNPRKTVLTIPEDLQVNSLKATHYKVAAQTNTSSGWIDSLYNDVPRPGTKDEFYATMIVMAMVRTKAKRRELVVDLPAMYQLNAEEQDFIIKTLLDNAYVTEFKINDNKSLQNIKNALIPTMARNRWLEASGYRPPLVDNYWRQAAKNWLVHLNEQNVLLPKFENEFFKRCVFEMGVTGLKEVLNFLNDEAEHEFIERIYGRDKPAFYAACPPGEFKQCLGLLIQHLRTQSYFPFSELGVSYQSGNDKDFISLLGEINQLDQFEKITLTDCLKNTQACRDFLKDLIIAAKKGQWVGLIVIPELLDFG